MHISHRHIRRKKALVVNALIQTAASPAHLDDISDEKVEVLITSSVEAWHNKKKNPKH